MADDIKVLPAVEQVMFDLDEEIRKLEQPLPPSIINLLFKLRRALREVQTVKRTDEERASLMARIRSSLDSMPAAVAVNQAASLYNKEFFENDGDVLFLQELARYLCEKFQGFSNAPCKLWEQYK